MKCICGFVTLAMGAIIVALVCANTILRAENAEWRRKYGDMHDRAAAISKTLDSIPPEPLPVYVNPVAGEIKDRGLPASRHKTSR